MYALLNVAALVVVIAGLKAAAPLVTQVLLIAFITIVVAPAYFQLVRWRMPAWLALTLLISTLSVGALYGIVALTQAMTALARQLPDYHRELRHAVARLVTWMAERDLEVPDTLFEEIVNVRNVTGWARDLAALAGGLLGRAFVVLLIVSFLLCEVATLPRRLHESRWMTPELWNRMVHVVADVRHYMNIKSVVSMATGITVYAGLRILQVDSALLLGLAAFVLNYIPTIGSIVAGIPAVLIALLQFGPGRAAWVAGLYLVVNQLFGSILEPRIMGRGFGVSPVVILLSLLFWGWVLGPVGMLLSVPLTMGAKVVFESLREIQPGDVARPSSLSGEEAPASSGPAAPSPAEPDGTDCGDPPR